ncbi:hypothetical protein IWQ60_002230 [Tieghemiomyces parasiticus]|uniref:Uncharacterized protein n=1 Tax=Tieghemiomyces parasiticus TaxID=78921 RepID=A0A9W8DXL0_9FUNG|nr:hypothetical protein IWQ60_002230 [Tieghemiomyces parasiticus]
MDMGETFGSSAFDLSGSFSPSSPGGIHRRHDMAALMMKSRPVLIYHAIFAASVVFDVAAWWDALLHSNLFLAGSMILFNGMLILYSVIQYFQHRSLMTLSDDTHDFTMTSSPLEFGLIATVSTVTVALIAVAYPLYRLFAWSFYEKLGADLQLRRMNLQHGFLLTLLKLDLFFFISYAVQLATLVLTVRDVGNILRISITLPGSLIVLGLGFYGLLYEKRGAMYGFLVGLVLGLAYILFELIYMAAHHSTVDDPYANSRYFLYFFTVILIVLIILSLTWGILCLRNVGRGLLQARREAKQSPLAAPPAYHGFKTESEADPLRPMGGRPTPNFAELRPLSNIEID